MSSRSSAYRPIDPNKTGRNSSRRQFQSSNWSDSSKKPLVLQLVAIVGLFTNDCKLLENSKTQPGQLSHRKETQLAQIQRMEAPNFHQMGRCRHPKPPYTLSTHVPCKSCTSSRTHRQWPCQRVAKAVDSWHLATRQIGRGSIRH